MTTFKGFNMHKMSALICLIIGFLASCSASRISHIQTVHGEKMLIGQVDKAEILDNFDAFGKNYELYEPNSENVRKIAQYSKKTHVEIFFGTWCGDSKRNLPPFLKTLDQSKNKNITYTIHGLDRTKTDKAGLTKKFNIRRVPTMVFLQDGREIGRIVEYPKETLDHDTMEILQNSTAKE